MNRNIEKYKRQIHLDFHTSPFIADVAQDFDATAFAERMKEAHVNSVTVFAKCHHGMCYYPTKNGIQHPALNGRDMLGEMIEALHKVGIRVPVYTTVAWEENVAYEHPQWRQMKIDGTFADLETSADGITVQPAGWKFMNWMHPEYQDYMQQHITEILSNYDADGLFLDIVFMHPKGGWDEQSLKFREEYGLTENTLKNQVLFESLAQEKFTGKFTKLTQSLKPDLSIFYNTPNNLYVDGDQGALKRAKFQTHFEIESLPSGFWGYFHFPRLARNLSLREKPWFGMTGKFQKMWGDFGGIKPKAALEYECFRSQALGGGNCIGDQLHPRGVLDEETYSLISSVYEQVEEAEVFYEGSIAIPQVGVLCPNYPGLDEDETSISEEGVVLMLEELHYDCAVIDEDADFSRFQLIVLPDTVVVSDKLRQSLERYLENDGKLIVSGKSGTDKTGQWNLPFLPYTPEGETTLFPNYWRVTNALYGEGANSERVIYQQGMDLRPNNSCTIYVNRVLPYFKRTDLKYCSHFQTPPDKTDENYPAVFGKDNIMVFADLIFREYRQSGNIFIRKVFKQIIQNLIGKAPYGEGLSPRILSVPRRRNDDLIITLLNYSPVRKALDIDVIEEPNSFMGEHVSFDSGVREVVCLNNATILKLNDKGYYELPPLSGRLLLQIKDHFK